MAQTIKLKRSTTTTNTPTLVSGEVGVNEADGLFFWRNSGGTVRRFNIKRERDVVSVTSSTSVTINADVTDLHAQTALAGAATYNAPSGTPANGQSLWLRIKDNGTARALTWNAVFSASQGAGLPSTTNGADTMYIHFIYNSSSSKWEAVGSLPMS